MGARARGRKRVWGQFVEARAEPERLRFPNPSALSRATESPAPPSTAVSPPSPARPRVIPRHPPCRVSSPPRPAGPFTAAEQPYSFVSSPYVRAHGGMQFRCRECALPDERSGRLSTFVRLLRDPSGKSAEAAARIWESTAKVIIASRGVEWSR